MTKKIHVAFVAFVSLVTFVSLAAALASHAATGATEGHDGHKHQGQHQAAKQAHTHARQTHRRARAARQRARARARANRRAVAYVCPMHADIRERSRGTCPKCLMELVAKPRDAKTGGAKVNAPGGADLK